MTTDTKNNNTTVKTPVFRVSFPAVFTPKAAPGSDKLKYSVVMLFDKTADLTAMKAAVKAAVIGRWGPDSTKWPKNLVLPFRKGEEKQLEGYGPGVVFATASANAERKPYVVDEAVQAIIDPSEFYGGCYAHAKVNAFAWPAPGKQGFGKSGVSFGLQGIQKVKDGESFSGKSNPENDFDAIPTPATGASAKTTTEDDGLGL